MSARFEIVRTDAEQPRHARFRAANGRVQWSTENYATRRAAINAVVSMALEFSTTSQVWLGTGRQDGRYVIDLRYGSDERRTWTEAKRVEVRIIDERAS